MRTNADTVLTKDQLNERLRRVNAMNDLRAHRVVVDPGCKLTTDQLRAMAEIAGGWAEVPPPTAHNSTETTGEQP